jgi:hypothetical protein
MTPLRAIKQECYSCKNGHQFICKSDMCQLNNKKLTNLKKIKAHCKTCVPSQNIEGVRKCSGKVMNPEPHDCYLFQYRLGRNPKRAGIGNKNFRNTISRGIKNSTVSKEVYNVSLQR